MNIISGRVYTKWWSIFILNKFIFYYKICYFIIIHLFLRVFKLMRVYLLDSSWLRINDFFLIISLKYVAKVQSYFEILFIKTLLQLIFIEIVSTTKIQSVFCYLLIVKNFFIRSRLVFFFTKVFIYFLHKLLIIRNESIQDDVFKSYFKIR